LLRRKKDLEAFAAHRTVEERDRIWLRRSLIEKKV
jgi:hypothetical protein